MPRETLKLCGITWEISRQSGYKTVPVEAVGLENDRGGKYTQWPHSENANGELRGIEWRVHVPFYESKERDRSEKGTGPVSDPMKEIPKHNEETLALKFKIRQTALRLVPPGGRLNLDDLRTALAGQGIEWDEAVVAEAISVLV